MLKAFPPRSQALDLSNVQSSINQFIAGLLLFLGFARVTEDYQNQIDLEAPLLVGFFLCGLLIKIVGNCFWNILEAFALIMYLQSSLRGARRRLGHQARAAVTTTPAGHGGQRAVSEMSDWIRDHKCSYNIQPVAELVEGAAMQLGYELNLYAEVPVNASVPGKLGQAIDELREELTKIMESLIPKDAKAHIERAPFRRAVRFLRGSGKPVVTRTIYVYHPDYSALEPGDREKLHPTETRLEEMGFTRA